MGCFTLPRRGMCNSRAAPRYPNSKTSWSVPRNLQGAVTEYVPSALRSTMHRLQRGTELPRDSATRTHVDGCFSPSPGHQHGFSTLPALVMPMAVCIRCRDQFSCPRSRPGPRISERNCGQVGRPASSSAYLFVAATCPSAYNSTSPLVHQSIGALVGCV